MEMEIPLIFVSLFSLASVALVVIYKFAIKEKSYEEALAEQRQHSQILLGAKPKLKEKKSKKPAKKGQSPKEKPTVEENESVSEVEEPETSQKKVEESKKAHVEFKEAAEDTTSKPTVNKKQTKKEKVRPILVNKDKPEIVPEKPTVVANHFEELHPKDDFELFRSTSTDETVEKKSAEVQKPSKKQADPEPVVVKEAAPTVSAPAANGIITNAGKEKKKKKSEFGNLQQLAADSVGPNMDALLNLVRKAELSRSEVQILIDLLLNKQHEAPAVIDEWSEGKSDPVQKLKKQLAEKEKLLAEEQQALAVAQGKLREIRSEHQGERSGLLQKIRQMEEIAHGKQLESSRFELQVQQLQNQLKEEVFKGNKLREEIAALQMSRQQIEMRLGQAQESEVLIGQLQGEVQEISTINGQLRLELQRLTEENQVEKERSKTLIFQLSSFQNESEQISDRNRQLEENRHKLERELETNLKREDDLKKEVTRLNMLAQKHSEEIRRLEHSANQYHDDLQKQKDESNKTISQLSADLRKVQEENKQIQATQMNGSLQQSKQHEVEILNLHNELSSVKTQLSHAQKESEKEVGAANALAEKLQRELEELKVKLNEEKSKVESQKNKNNELRERNWKVMEALNVAESRQKASPKTKSDEDIQREFVQRLFPEIKDEEVVNAQLFKTAGEKFIRNYIDNLRTLPKEESLPDQTRLELEHYKKVIDSTEKMLNQLQKHIEQEEIKWRVQLAAKADELEAVKESHRKELHEKLTQLETELLKEQEDKKKLLAQLTR